MNIAAELPILLTHTWPLNCTGITFNIKNNITRGHNKLPGWRKFYNEKLQDLMFSPKACVLFFPLLWPFDPIPGNVLPLRGFAVTFIGHSTLRRTPLYEL